MFRKPKMWVALVIVTAISAVAVSSAAAWNAIGVTVSADCVVDTYKVSVTIQQSQQYPGAFVKSVSPASFTGITSGTQPVTVVIGWPNSTDTQTFNKSVTLDGKCIASPPAPKCPAGTVQDSSSTSSVLVCIKTVEKPVPGPTVYVDRPVPGPTVTNNVPVPGPTVYVDKPGPERIVEKTVTVYGKAVCPKGYKTAKGGPGAVLCTKTITNIRTKIKTITKVRVVRASKPAYTR